MFVQITIPKDKNTRQTCLFLSQAQSGASINPNEKKRKRVKKRKEVVILIATHESWSSALSVDRTLDCAAIFLDEPVRPNEILLIPSPPLPVPTLPLLSVARFWTWSWRIAAAVLLLLW